MTSTLSQTVFSPWLTPARLVSTSNIVGQYYNGPSNNGVGATLTIADTSLTVDSVEVNVGDRLLLQLQTTAYEQGIYIVYSIDTTVVLQRAADQQSLEQMKAGQYLAISAGLSGAGSLFTLVEPLPEFIGLDPINFISSVASGSGTINAGGAGEIAYYESNGTTLSALTVTGSGSAVKQEGPSIVSPSINTIYDSNNNEILNLIAVTDAVNYLTMSNSAGEVVTIGTAGTSPNVALQLESSGVESMYFSTGVPSSGASLIFATGTSSRHITNMVFADTNVAQTITWPDATGTLALVGESVTFSGSPSVANDLAVFSDTSGNIKEQSTEGANLPYGLTIASGDVSLTEGTVVALSAELNLIYTGATLAAMVDPGSSVITIAPGATNTATITIQLKDGSGNNITRSVMFVLYASSTADGLTLASPASTGFSVSSGGLDLSNSAPETTLISCMSSATGSCVISLLDTAQQTSYLVLALPGGNNISAQLTSGDYGA